MDNPSKKKASLRLKATSFENDESVFTVQEAVVHTEKQRTGRIVSVLNSYFKEWNTALQD